MHLVEVCSPDLCALLFDYNCRDKAIAAQDDTFQICDKVSSTRSVTRTSDGSRALSALASAVVRCH